MNSDMPTDYAYKSLDYSSYDLAFLKNRGVVNFVHFTPAENLPGILGGGLFHVAILTLTGKNTFIPIAIA